MSFKPGHNNTDALNLEKIQIEENLHKFQSNQNILEKRKICAFNQFSNV